MPKKPAAPVIDFNDPHEIAHHSRYLPEGVTVTIQRSEPGREGLAIDDPVEVTGFVKGMPKSVEIKVELAADSPLSVEKFIKTALKERQRPMTAREAAAKAMGKK